MTGYTRRDLLNSGALAALYGIAQPAFTQEVPSVTWRNWSGGVIANPKGRFTPASEDELLEFLASTSGTVRPVGSGHSFTPLVPTDGHLIVIDQLSGLLEHDATTLRATFGAGTRLGDMGEPLAAIGQGMFNLPDIDRQTLAGATATATHGTGISFTCLSGYVTSLRLVTPRGEVLDVNAENPDLFNAARVSLGALGVITRMTLQNRDEYRLKAMSDVQLIEEVLEGFGRLRREPSAFRDVPADSLGLRPHAGDRRNG